MSTKQGSLSAQASRRARGGELILKGFSDEEIIEVLDVSISTVRRWRVILKQNHNDLLSLQRKKGSGRPPLLSEEQSKELKAIIEEGAIAAGYEQERWTSKVIADMIKSKFHIYYSPRAVRDWLKSHGLSYRKPKKRSRKYSASKVEQWRQEEWPRIKKKRVGSAYP